MLTVSELTKKPVFKLIVEACLFPEWNLTGLVGLLVFQSNIPCKKPLLKSVTPSNSPPPNEDR
jgi:hypothetical protein